MGCYVSKDKRSKSLPSKKREAKSIEIEDPGEAPNDSVHNKSTSHKRNKDLKLDLTNAISSPKVGGESVNKIQTQEKRSAASSPSKGGSPMKGQIVLPTSFITIREGLINNYYKTGKMLGEGIWIAVAVYLGVLLISWLGTFGRLYQVQHKTTGMLRVMRVVKKKSLSKEEEEIFFSECNTLKNIEHPNVPKLYESYQDEHSYYLISELCPGGELFDHLQTVEALNEKTVADYMKQILSAIAFCHTKDILHRNLKPENLLLDSRSAEARLKVVEFGVSKKFNTSSKVASKMSSTYYVAPEAVDREYNEKCDVWSCGVIMYTFLCGCPPFDGPNQKDILQKIKTGSYLLDGNWEDISQGAKDLIKKMLALNPADRISVEQALNSEWIQSNTSTNQLNRKVLMDLLSFHRRTKLKQAIMTFIVSQMTYQQDTKELNNVFDNLDQDGSGILTKEEVIEAYKKVFYDRSNTEAEIRILIQEVDPSHSGHVVYPDFITKLVEKEKAMAQKRLEEAFKAFDNKNKGYIAREELGGIVRSLGLDDENWRKLLMELTINPEGNVSMSEFVNMMGRLSKVEH